MANTPKKMKDPTEAALSAIQDALQVRDEEKSSATENMQAASAPASDDPPLDKPWPGLRAKQPTKTAGPNDDEIRLPEDPGALRRPAANDDRESIGTILRSLQRRPTKTSYILASSFAAVWLIGGIGLGFLYLAQLQAALGPTGLTAPVLTVLGAIYVAPVVFFFVLAHMAVSTQEMRMAAQSMAEVAMRLAEPETVARESIVTVGQAIRREVAAMGDGIERALARAAELETLVANEVSALEHAYNDNEVRIRTLLQDLGSQRDTLVGQAEQVRDAINGVHLDLSNDISQISDLVAEQVNDAARRITHTLAEKGEHITRALAHAGDNIIEQLGERSGDLLERLDSTGTNTSEAIAQASDRLTATLNFKTDHIGDEFTEIAANLQHMMSVRLDRVADSFSQKSAGILDMMTGRTQQLTELVVDTGNELADAITARVEEVNTSLKTTGDSLVLDLSLRGGDVVNKLEITGARITETIVQRGNKVSDTFRESAEQLAEVVGSRGDSVREMLSARLQSFEDMFNHGGSELAERIARDSTTLGNLVTRHLGEFDRTVKTYGGEMVERLGERTQEITVAMRNYLENFDARVTTKTAEVTAGLDQQFVRFKEALDGRTQTLNEALAARVVDIAKTLSEGGKDVVGALDKRISDVTTVINVRGAQLAETLGAKIDEVDKSFGQRATVIANNIDARIGRFEELLIGRAESVTKEIEARGKATADTLGAQVEHLSHTIKTHTSEAERALTGLATSTTTAVNSIEVLLIGRAESVTKEIEARGKATADMLGAQVEHLSHTIKTHTTEAERALTGLATSTTTAANSIRTGAQDAQRTLTEVARDFVGKADGVTAAVSASTGEMKKLIDDKSSVLLTALSGKSQEFANEVSRVTDHAVKAIEAKGFTFTRTMMDNSEQIARMINDAGEAAATNVTRTLHDLEQSSRSAIEISQKTAAAAVSEMTETHNILRTDTTVLFERLREANILLQEVLSGAHDNMGEIESALVTRVADFVTAMNHVSQQTGATSQQVEQLIVTFRHTSTQTLADLGQLSAQFDSHGRALADAVALVDDGNRRTESALNDRRQSLASLASLFDSKSNELEIRLAQISTHADEALSALNRTIETKTGDLDRRMGHFSSVLDQTLEGAGDRTREIARLVAESTNVGARAIAENLETIRAANEEEYKRAAQVMQSIYDRSAGDANAMFNDAAQRFAEVLQGLKQMTSEMQNELDSTRTELRKGILELPQETAESAAQMRRVIVDQIEALAELNRIVARHGRSLDAVEPMARRVEPAEAPAPRREAVPAGSGSRPEPARGRADIASIAPSPISSRRAESPALSPAGQGGGTRGGWLSDLLNRASQDSEPSPRESAAREAAPDTARTERLTIESLDSIAVDIARMIDHEAAAELWDRYKRGERNVFTRKLYTMQGQRTFEEIRRKYRADREFMQTVDRYIAEFERLLEEVARDDRGQVVTRTYLTSETGKVYTMLAHAAGRFDQ